MGGGPEIVYYGNGLGNGVRPYVGAGLLLTRGTERTAADQIAQGATVSLRAGFSVRASDSVGYFVQTAFQHDRLAAHRIPVTSKTVGIGLGLTAYLD